MLCLLSSLLLVAHLSEDNFTEFLSPTQAVPAFVLLKSGWCPHCREMAPDWAQLSSKYESHPGIAIVDILCDTDGNLCSNFSDSGTPRIFWATRGVDSAERFRVSHKFADFVPFLDRKLSPYITHIANHTDYLRAQEDNLGQSLIVIQELNPIGIEPMIQSMQADFQECPIRVFKLDFDEFNSTDPVLFHQFGVSDQTVKFSGTFDVAEIHAFIDKFCFPPIARASAFFLQEMLKQDFFLLFYEEQMEPFEDNLTQLTSRFPVGLKVGTIDCRLNLGICQVFGLRPFAGTQLVLVRHKKNIYYKFDGDFADSAVLYWLSRAINGKEPALGRGAGVSGFFYNLDLYLQKQPWWNWWMFTGVGFFVVLLCYLISRCCCRRAGSQAKPVHPKKQE